MQNLIWLLVCLLAGGGQVWASDSPLATFREDLVRPVSVPIPDFRLFWDSGSKRNRLLLEQNYQRFRDARTAARDAYQRFTESFAKQTVRVSNYGSANISTIRATPREILLAATDPADSRRIYTQKWLAESGPLQAAVGTPFLDFDDALKSIPYMSPEQTSFARQFSAAHEVLLKILLGNNPTEDEIRVLGRFLKTHT